MTKVKICGLSRHEDVDIVNAERPEYIGFVFADSRRKVTPEQARGMREKLCSDIKAVGVFVNEPAENIISLVRDGTIDAVQLHGSETEEYIRRLKGSIDVSIIRSVNLRDGDLQKKIGTIADYLLLDGGAGGEGSIFDWSLAKDIGRPYFLAGGLCPSNVAEAIERTRPFAVDVSSGVETEGLKDPEKIREFIRKVRNE